jgi:DNA-binding MarR family transcriptional regulator
VAGKSEELPLPTDLARQILAAIGALRREVRRTAGAPWPSKDFTNAQGELLTVVRRRPGISVTDAADEMGLAANTVSTLVGQLTRLGELQRTRDEQDRRIARLDLAPEARVRAEAWQDRRVELVASVIASYKTADRRAIGSSWQAIANLTERIRAVRDDAG